MPATMTHACFAKDVYDILPDDIKNSLSISRLKMFGQSTDSLMFYNLLSLSPGKDIRKFQSFFHRNQSQEFFLNLIRYIKDNYINDSDTLSFLVGFICHYILDSTIHPYIFYKTGNFIKGKKETFYTYAGLGDLLLTATSAESRNFTFGLLIGMDKDFKTYLEETTVEGVESLKTTKIILEKNNLNSKIIDILDDVVNNCKDKNIILKFLKK